MSTRVAVIGAGIMGADHARIFAEDIPGARLEVVCDVSQAAARRIADSCSARDIATDAHAVIQRSDVDAIVIASPDNTHTALVKEALSLRKPVLCEKPLGVNSAECLEVIAAETEIGMQLLQVGFMRRFDHAYLAMKNALTSGQIGQSIMMHNQHRNVEAPTPEFSAMMAITNSAPHEFDAIRYILDTEISSVSAFQPALATGSECKPVVLVLTTHAGQLVTVEVNNMAAYGYDVRGELVGTQGSVSLGHHESVRLDSGLNASTAYAADWRPRFADAYRQQDKAWINAINHAEAAPFAANAWDGYCATAIAEAGVSALRSGAPTAVNLADRPALYGR